MAENHAVPDLTQLAQWYEEAHQATRTFREVTHDPMKPEEKERLRELERAELGALATFYEAGGSRRTVPAPVGPPDIEPWVRQAQIEDAVQREMAGGDTSPYSTGLVAYREASRDLSDAPSSTTEK